HVFDSFHADQVIETSVGEWQPIFHIPGHTTHVGGDFDFRLVGDSPSKFRRKIASRENLVRLFERLPANARDGLLKTLLDQVTSDQVETCGTQRQRNDAAAGGYVQNFHAGTSAEWNVTHPVDHKRMRTARPLASLARIEVGFGVTHERRL